MLNLVNGQLFRLRDKIFLSFPFLQRIAIFFAVFGPATITAMADNDASGVATYSIAGAKLGYPILFVLLVITPLLAITQEMGVRLTVITKKGLGDLIRENFGVRTSFLIFTSLLFANLATITVDLTAIKTASSLLNLPTFPFILVMLITIVFFVIKGGYKLTQNIMLISSLFYLTYVFSAFRAKPDWNLALSNLFVPHSIQFNGEYLRNFLFIGLGVIGTTITPWGQFFISSFAFDKKIAASRIKFAQIETYVGAFLTNFFSFFMVVATAATLFVNGIPLATGEQAALAIKPFAGEMAGVLFAVGILNAGFMGVVIVSLSTAYAFSEFFGLSGSLDRSFTQNRGFYIIFLFQLAVAAIISLFPQASLFKLAVTAQVINAIMLPLVFKYLIHFTSSKNIMGNFVNSDFKRRFAKIATVIIIAASIAAILSAILGG